MNAPKNLWWIALLALILLVCGARYAVMAPVHGWSDDGSVYLQHAENLLHGQPYNHVLFGQTPSNKSPAALYPPMLPVVLAAEIPFTGLDFHAFKITMLVIYALALAAAGFALYDLFGTAIAISTVILLALSFELGRIADHINSDFLLLLLLCLLILWEDHAPRRIWSLIVTALLVLAIFETRTAGIVVLPALILYRFWAASWSRRDMGIGAALCVLFLAVSIAMNQGGGNYFGQLRTLISPMTIRRNLIQYLLCLGDVFTGGKVIALLLDALALAGLYAFSKTGKRSLWIVFLVFYLPMMILWPFSDPVRFALPFLPLVIALALLGVVSLVSLFAGRPLQIAALALLTVLLCAREVKLYAAGEESNYPSGINHPRTLELYKAIAADLPPSAVIVCRKPRTISLMTGKHAVIYPMVDSAPFVTDLCRAGATHIVAAPGIFEDDAKYVEPVIQRNLSRMKVIFHNDQYTLYSWPSELCRVP